MTERLLQYIWQSQYLSKGGIRTTGGESVLVLFPGVFNKNQGPDFTDAQIKIDTTIWVGTVELHLKTSDWIKHRHQNDPNYHSVILHVVWEDDGSKNNIPVVELKDRVSKILLQRYDDLMNSTSFIPCEKSIQNIGPEIWKCWKQQLVRERLMRRTQTIESYLRQCNYHWEETFWWILARNFGMKVNADAFESMARSLPVTLLARHKSHIHQLEGLLLGQAGLIVNQPKDDYAQLLRRDYDFHRIKYQLVKAPIRPQFLRMRPGNFPTLRLAQLAMLIHVSAHLFSVVKETASAKEIKSLFSVSASDYWDFHYRFDEISRARKKKLGKGMIDHIMINSLAPVVFAYGHYHDEELYMNKSIGWLQETTAERNTITLGFLKLGIANKNSFDSQALTELKNEYCNKKKCLDCSIGKALVSGNLVSSI